MAPTEGGKDGSRRVSTRNPRRRQRTDADSLGHQPRRKRSKITTETYDSWAVPDAVPNGGPVMNGHAEPRGRKSVTPVDSVDMPLRSKKSGQKRAVKGDASTVMLQTAQYCMKHLPSTPDIIRNSASDYRGSVLSSPPYALAITRERACIWDYTSSAPVLNPRTFDIPSPVKSSDPVPLGALVTNGASVSVGLVIISSTTGKIIFWENIDTAESLSLFGNRNIGVEGSLGGLFSGETAIDITSAEHAGFIVTLSSGRIAQIGLRDAQGKPKISAQFLRSNDSGGGGGIFGSIRGVLGVGWKRDVVGVRTRSQGSRGQMQVISATAGAQLQVWDLAWSGQASYRGAIDFRDMLQNEIARHAKSQSQRNSPAKLVDFAVLPSRGRGDEVAVLGDDQPLDLVLLAQSDAEMSPTYVLIDATIAGNKLSIERVMNLKGGSAANNNEKPRLLLPKPGHTAFVLFETDIMVVALSGPEPAGPEAQLMTETHSAPKTFQDVVHLRQDRHLIIQGSSEEDLNDKQGQSSCIVFIKGLGLARVSAREEIGELSPRVPAKTRIEQAIFYGTQPENILDFHQIDQREYPQKEIEEAARAISDEVLRSDTPYIPTSAPSIEAHILLRQKAMRALIAHLNRHYTSISHSTRWKLLSEAEKLASGLALWTEFDAGLQKSGPKPSVLPAVVKVVRRKVRGVKVTKESEIDEVRHWFTHDLEHIDRFYLQALALVYDGYENGTISNLMKCISECDDILFNVFETVYAFRSDHAELYGIDPSLISDGIMEEGWKDLPEPWTATHELLNSMDNYVDLARNYTAEFYEKPENHQSVDEKYVDKVVRENVRLVQILCSAYRERIAFCEAHFAEKFRNYAPGLRDRFKRSRDHQLRGLTEVGLARDGLAIAEKYKDMDSLVSLVITDSAYLIDSQGEARNAEEEAVIQARMEGLQANVDRYFRVFGDDFATAFFDSHLASNHSYGLLKEAKLYQEPLTRYLRAEEARGRLGWINEILHENDMSAAHKALQSLAQEHEGKLWNKKVELSLSKLTALAAQEQKQGLMNGTGEAALKTQDRELEIVAVQEQIYRHLLPTFYTAVDHDAEVQLVSDAYAVSIRRPLPALHQLLDFGFDDLLNHKALPAEQLVDMLTLMDSVPSTDPDVDISGHEFHLAMKVLEAARPSMTTEHFQTALNIVWKRCYIQDDWELMNSTSKKSDKLIARQLRETSLCQTLVLGLQDVLSSPTSGITPLAPTDCIGSGSHASHLRHRFPSDDLLDPIIHDNSVQDKQLQKAINKNDLPKWLEACKAEAQKILDEEADARRAETAALEDVKKGLEGAGTGVKIAANGHGHGGEEDEDEDEEIGTHAEGKDGEDEDADADADGDVEMS